MNKLDEEIFNYYEKLAPDYDHNRFGNTYGAFINTQEERLLSPLLHSKKCVLDLACGTGRFLKYAHEGLDVSPAML
ncbi:MAG: class I SAM-dependent methyltransferase, partial [Flammeovirgaceae bacterium]